jgi:hypothetical protein
MPFFASPPENLALIRNEIHMTGELATPGNENVCSMLVRRIESVLGRMAGYWNGAHFVPETKLARWTCGTPDWSRRAAEELQPRDVDCFPARKGVEDDQRRNRTLCRY